MRPSSTTTSSSCWAAGATRTMALSNYEANIYILQGSVYIMNKQINITCIYIYIYIYEPGDEDRKLRDLWESHDWGRSWQEMFAVVVVVVVVVVAYVYMYIYIYICIYMCVYIYNV